MISVFSIIAAAFVASEGGEELRLYQTTASKNFREIATSGFTIHPYPAAPALDVDHAKGRHEFLGLGGALTDASAWVLANMPEKKREKLYGQLMEVAQYVRTAWRTPQDIDRVNILNATKPIKYYLK